MGNIYSRDVAAALESQLSKASKVIRNSEGEVFHQTELRLDEEDPRFLTLSVQPKDSEEEPDTFRIIVVKSRKSAAEKSKPRKKQRALSLAGTG